MPGIKGTLTINENVITFTLFRLANMGQILISADELQLNV